MFLVFFNVIFIFFIIAVKSFVLSQFYFMGQLQIL